MTADTRILEECLHELERLYEKCKERILPLGEVLPALKAIDRKVVDALGAGTDEFHRWQSRQGGRQDWIKKSMSGYAGTTECEHFSYRMATLQSILSELSPESLRNRAEIDDLTGVPNRSALDAELTRIQAARANLEQTSLIMADIDHFKSINDKHGHDGGDKVLRAVADTLRAIVRGKGSVYRYGGEEFTIVLPNFTLDESIVLAERARKEIEALSINDIRLTASFGVATLPVHRSEVLDVLKAADIALYDAKNLGRNIVRYFDEAKPVILDRRPPKREASADGLSEKQREEIRARYFQEGIAHCPRDGAVLAITKGASMSADPVRLFVFCEMCGLKAHA